MKKPRALKRSPLIARLIELGCEFCPRCYAFMYPDHTEHIRSLALDAHESRYVLTGGYGEVQVADLREAA